MKRKYCSSFSIFEYWKDKCITEKGDVLIEYGYEGCNKEKLKQVDSIPVVYDWGEPRCFACNVDIAKDEFFGELDKVWNEKNLTHIEKAHIIPSSLGGNENCDNMFIMCKTCHKESPDTIYKKEFFKFVYRRRKEGNKYKRAFYKAVEELKKDNIPIIFIGNDFLGLDKVTSHGAEIQESTIVSAIVGSATENFNKANKITF